MPEPFKSIFVFLDKTLHMETVLFTLLNCDDPSDFSVQLFYQLTPRINNNGIIIAWYVST